MAHDNERESDPPTFEDLLSSGFFRVATEGDGFCTPPAPTPTPDRSGLNLEELAVPGTRRRVPNFIMSMAEYGEIIAEQDIEPLLAAVDLKPTSTMAHTEIARRLDSAAMTFVLEMRALSTSTAGEVAKFLVWMDESIGRVLAPLSAHGSFDRDLERLAHILRGDNARVPIELDADETLRRWVRDTLALQRRLREVAEGFGLQKSAKREAPQVELEFLKQLAEIFEDVFEREPGYSTDSDGVRGGPAVRFVIEIAVLIQERLPAVAMDGRDDPVPDKLERLTRPGVVADRIRDVRGGSPRKR